MRRIIPLIDHLVKPLRGAVEALGIFQDVEFCSELLFLSRAGSDSVDFFDLKFVQVAPFFECLLFRSKIADGAEMLLDPVVFR